MKEITSIKEADQVIEEYKNDTSYFSEDVSQEKMFNMLRFDMRFGQAETLVIIASLIKAGAKFRKS